MTTIEFPESPLASLASEKSEVQPAQQPGLEIQIGDIHRHILPRGRASLPTLLATYTLKAS
jgi:hypothetical protein